MIDARISKHLRPGHHPLTKLVRKTGERRFVNPKSSKASPCKRHRHPSLLDADRFSCCFDGCDQRNDTFEPSSRFFSVAKRKELVPSSERWYTAQQHVLDVIEFEHH